MAALLWLVLARAVSIEAGPVKASAFIAGGAHVLRGLRRDTQRYSRAGVMSKTMFWRKHLRFLKSLQVNDLSRTSDPVK